MALSTSPRKLVVPLASGDEPRSQNLPVVPSITKRVFYCGVVVEGSENGRRLPEEIQELVLSFGDPFSSEPSTDILVSTPSPSLNEIDRATQRKRALMDTSTLTSVINELITSEKSYVKRLQMLKYHYADPLRRFARSKDTVIIPAYEAKTLFGNIDNLLPVNEAFLTDLERMAAPNGYKVVGGVGDVALRHFKELRGFEQYKQYYVKREDAQAIFEREVSKRSSGFADYIDRIKYQSDEANNRVGLRELLMEPVQRIPRYTLLFRTMLKHMSPEDPQRPKIMEADEIASKIAQAEADEQTKRAAIFYCLIATIDGFPPDLFSNSRRFIDCIDVEDIITDAPMSSASSSTSVPSSSLHCSLFLFDDKVVIVKRPNAEKGARSLSGLDGVDKVTKAGGIPTGKKKSGMTCKGVVDITDVVATDIGGTEINLYLENPPQDQTDRWSGRPFRSLSVVNPPMPSNLDPIQTDVLKQKFLESLWTAQATYRARAGQSVVLRADEQEVECRSGRVTLARTYFNVYQRTAFLQEHKKTKVVVHIDPLGSADPLPFGIGGPPFAVIRVQPMAGGLCRYAVSSSEPGDEAEEDIVQTGRVPSRVVQTIHQFGLFEFKTGKISLPSTPTHRSKASIFGLDAISRNLFNSRPGSSMGDFFSGSINGHRRNRSRSTTSRSSMYTQTTTTVDSMKSSHRSNSTATAATTMSTMDDDTSFFSSRSSKGKKLSKRSTSLVDTTSNSEHGSFSNLSRSQPHSRSSSRGPDPDYSDVEDDSNTILEKSKMIGSSDYNLAVQLELARQNSLNQHGKRIAPMQLDAPVEAIIYEEEPPNPVRPASQISGEISIRSTTPRPTSPAALEESPPQQTRALSNNPSERRPIGPRSPSPLPPQNSESHLPYRVLPSMDDDFESESNRHLPSLSSSDHHSKPVSNIPRSKRQPFFPTGNTDTPKPSASHGLTSAPTLIEPLSIKKKGSIRPSAILPGSPTPARRSRNSPLNRNFQRLVSPRRVSPQIRKSKPMPSSYKTEDFERVQHLSVSTKQDIETSRRTIKRIKLEVNTILQSTSEEDSYPRSVSPEKGLRVAQPTTPMTKAAQERMEEMRNLIGRRQEETPRGRTRTAIFTTPSRTSSETSDVSRTIDMLVADADQDLVKAQSHQDILQNELRRLASEFKERAAELERTRLELQSSKRQCELFRNLWTDATAEKEIMYEAFNEELDGMYNDANLPDDEAWVAMAQDLRETKESRNNLTKENSQLKRKLAEVDLQREDWGDLLRAHGLIS